MTLREKIRIACRVLGVMAIALALQACTSLLEQSQPVPSDEVKIAAASFQGRTTTRAYNRPRPYFIEFKGEFYSYPGHAYFVYGEMNDDGTIARQYGPVGFNARFGLLGHLMGSVAVAPGTFEPYPWDDKLPAMASYFVELTPLQYSNLLAFIERTTSETRYYNIYAQNCTAYIAEAAQVVGLKVPGGLPFMYPPVFVNKIKSLNTS